MENDTDTSKNTSESSSESQAAEFSALQSVIGALQPLSTGARQRILSSVATFLSIGAPQGAPSRPQSVRTTSSPTSARTAFSDDTAMTAKEFLLEKQPRTDVERMACLAFYLTHYEDTPHFKTLELSKLNTLAAQPKFSNAAQAANNAVKTGYLVASTKGQRQLSAAGEQFVRAMPDRDAARSAMSAARPRRRTKRAKSAGSSGKV